MALNSILSRVVVIGTFVVGTTDAAAQSGVFVPIQYGQGHECIDVSHNNVSMQVVSVQAERTDTFWKKSEALGLKIDVRLTDREGKSFTFPRGRTVTAKKISGSIGKLPIHFPIMSKYSLRESDKDISNVALDVFLLNIEKESDAVNALFKFVKFSENLPLPPHPFISGVQHFGAFAQEIVNDNVQSDPEKLPVATFSFDLATNPEDAKRCPETALRRGVNAVIFDYEGKFEDGFVKLSDVRNLCFYYEKYSNIILFEKKNSTHGDDCPDTASATARQVENPLVAFIVNKYTKDPEYTGLDSKTQALAESFKETKWAYGGSENLPYIAETTLSPYVADFTSYGMTTGILVSEAKVKRLYESLAFEADSLGEFDETLQSLRSLDNKPATSLDVDAAIAIYTCAFVGISPLDCR